MKLERVTSHGAGVINAEERDEVDMSGEGVLGGRRGSIEKTEYDERRGRSVGEGRGFELPSGNVAGQEAQQSQQAIRPEPERQGSAGRMSGLMNRLRSSSGRRSPSAKRS